MKRASNSLSTRGLSRAKGGFTLVEVMLAIGVLSCAVLPLTALLPHGVDTLHTSIRQNSESRIQQEIVGRLATTDWDSTNDLSDLNQSVWYFDDNGAPVDKPASALYTASLEISDSTLPGSDSTNHYLRTLVIKVTDLPAVLKPFNDPTKYRRYVSTLSKMDK